MKTLDFNFFQFIILLGSIQALIFGCIIFFSKKYRSRGLLFLGLMVFFTALSNIQHMLIDMDFLGETSSIRKIYVPIQWLILPLFYVHVHEFKFGKRIKSQTWILVVLPFFFVFGMHLFHFLYQIQLLSIQELPDYYEPGFLLYTNLASFIFNGYIIYRIYKMLRPNAQLNKNISSAVAQKIKVYRNIIQFAIISISIGTVTVLVILLFDGNPSFLYYPFFVVVSFAIYWIGYVGVFKIKNPRTSFKPAVKNNNSSTFNKIDASIRMQKCYLDREVSLDNVASKFKISSGYLSHLVNTYSKKNFNDYINGFRVEAAKKRLINEQYKHYTIESIGLECGFKSKSNFYTAFKKIAQQTPNEYRKTSK